MKNYTPLKDIDDKLDIIEHINQDHTEEIALIVQDKLPKVKRAAWRIASAKIDDIFEEGLTVHVTTKDHGEHIIPVDFELEGELEEQILYLAYLAMVKQGKDLSGNKKHYFEVVGKQQLTPHITRLTLKSAISLPSNYAGYAYSMVLKTLNKPPKTTDNKKPHALLKKMGNHAFLWGLKKMSSDRRQKVVASMSKNTRLYTLRAAWQADDADFLNSGYMDVFTHVNGNDMSAGSQWCDSLAVGDVVFSRGEYTDNHQHLNTGQQVLIADETAYPAVAGLLDLWENPLPPQLIVVSKDHAEQAYFDNSSLSKSLPTEAAVHRIVAEVDKQAELIIEKLDTLPKIDGAWAGLESQTAKKVRHHLRNQHKLSGKANRVKAYWRLK